MKGRRIFAVAAVALAVTLPAGLAPAGETPATATVDVAITVIPYAEVRMDQATLSVTIAADSTTYGPVYLSGMIACNCSVMVFAEIEPPAGAPGSWYASAMVVEVDEPGVHVIDQLVRIVVTNASPGYSGTLDILDGSLGQSVTPTAGQVVVTVMQF